MAKSRPTPPPEQRTRGLSRFKRTETARLLKGALDAGLSVRGIEIDPGTGALRVLVESARTSLPMPVPMPMSSSG